MLERFPAFYDRFVCLAGACPHTCCALWEVVVDEETAARYRREPGALGQRLRAALTEDEDGDPCFPLRGGRCPFLNEKNLCEIHLRLGEEATSVTCREHPRFVEEYGPFREITLSASCPEANRLLFDGDGPLTWAERETAEETEPGDPWLRGLVPLRDTLLAVLADRSRPLHRRLTEVLLLAAAGQELLDFEEIDDLADLTPESVEVGTLPQGPGLFPASLELLAGLERLEADWGDLLEQAKAAAPACQEQQAERVAAYAAFRYLLKCVNDGDLLGRAQLCVFLTLAAERIGGVCGIPEALRRLSCEIEHSDDNLEALLEAFRTCGAFGLDCFLRELSAL